MAERSAWRMAAKRRWPDAVWITGDGPIALIAPCREMTVTLWKTREEAQQEKARIDRAGCGGMCNPVRHQIVELSDVGDDA